jgi:hypothetical protein
VRARPRSTRRALAALILTLLVALAVPREVLAIDTNFAGSGQIDYHFVPTARDANARASAFDGFTMELSGKVALDFSDRLSANMKVCYGCHGFETDMAYFDYRVADELGFRLGRFSPSFGGFNLRHDPANHRLSDKPLPYDMGRMLRLRGWNMGVLPSPFPDNGLEIGGKLALAERSSFDYAIYAVSGFKGSPRSLDFDFVQSRDGNAYYVDNNGRPTLGGRLALDLGLSRTSEATLGASVMHGTYDPANDFSYTIVGADLGLRVGRTNVRLEYLVRRQAIDTSDPTLFRYDVGPNGGFVVKHGAYAELETPLASGVDALARVDGLFRVGNVLATPAGAPAPVDGELASRSSVARATLGTAVSLERNLRMKASTELWGFSDRDAAGHTFALGFHLAAVGTF